MRYIPHDGESLVPALRPFRAPQSVMGKSVRQRKLSEIIAHRGECSIEQLAGELGVSEMTIRRDLQVLSEHGKIVRTHGGAAVGERISFEFEFLKRVEENQEAKAAIARLAAGRIENGSSVLLDSGTTTLAIADALRSKEDVTVITTSLPIAARLQFFPGVQILLLGGYVRASSPDLEGALTESNLESLRADVAFLGADGIDRDGWVYHRSPEIARLVSKMSASTDESYFVADSSKLDRTALFRSRCLQGCAGVITDPQADEAFMAELARQGVRVLVAAD